LSQSTHDLWSEISTYLHNMFAKGIAMFAALTATDAQPKNAATRSTCLDVKEQSVTFYECCGIWMTIGDRVVLVPECMEYSAADFEQLEEAQAEQAESQNFYFLRTPRIGDVYSTEGVKID